jgi:redox-sensitive bicupin YhaK (pirin superfamily)
MAEAMLEIRRNKEIHSEEGGWFKARWHFSFDRYRDPRQMGIGPLRVFNDDRLVPGADWPMHPHADVEGLTYVVEGTFEHADSLGNNGRLQPGGVQRMTLGSGALHSERNGSKTEPMRFLQFWILPNKASLKPDVEQRQFGPEDLHNQLRPVIGTTGDVVKVHQDASAYVGQLDEGVAVEHNFKQARAGYLYLIRGEAELNGDARLLTGDAVKIRGPEPVRIRSKANSELILIEVPGDYAPVGVWR